MSDVAPTTARPGDASSRRHIYLRLYTTTAVGLVGDAIASIGLPLAFLARTGSVGLAATLAASTTIPQVALALPASAISDRLPRKPVVTLSYVVEACCLLLLAAMLRWGSFPMGVVILLGAVRGICGQLGVAASAGYIPSVLGRDALLGYHSRVETVEGIAAIGGPPLAGAIMSGLGAVASMTVPAMAALANAGMYLALPSVARPSSASGSFTGALRHVPHDIAEGIGHIRRHATMTAVVLVHLSLGATTGSYVFAVVDRLRRVMGTSGYEVGVVMSATGVGGIIGSLVIERLFPLHRAREVLAGSLLVIGVVLAAFGLTRHVMVAVVLLAVLDLACVACFIFGGTLQQYAVPDEYLARVESINDLAFLAGSAAAVTAAARVVPTWGSATFLFALAATTALPLVYLLTCNRQRWDAELVIPDEGATRAVP